MISTLTGRVSEKLEELVVIDVGGVGYGLLVCAEDYGKLAIGNDAKVYVHEHVREQAYDLFGFTNLTTKKLFEQLLSVKNVGPKVALAVLDIGSSDEVRSAIASGDVKRLQTAKGVGKRAAEQMVVELRDKVGELVGAGAENIIGRAGIDQSDEASQALVALGYSEADALTALAKVDKDLPLEQRVKEALRG